MRWIPLFGAALLCGSLGCDSINTDPTIFVDVTVEDPTVNAVQKALGTEITGGFTLSLHLGARAAGSSEVSVEQFELLSEDQNTIVVESLPLAAAEGALPITVDPDTDEDVDIVIDQGSDLLTPEDGQKLCAFGTVRYRGSISDSLRGTSIPVLTDAIVVTGCTPGT